MPETINGHVVPIDADYKNTDTKEERTRMLAILRDLCGAINTSGQLTSGVTAAGTTLSGASNGAVETGVTAVEHGDSVNHITILTLATAFGAIAGGAALALGKKLYTFPAGKIFVKSAYMSINLNESDGNITADTPDVGIGTVVGSAAVATLDGTGTFESILTGQTAPDCNATVFEAGVNTPLLVTTAGAHTVFLNIADTWAASGEAAMAVAGTIVLEWSIPAA